MLRFLAVMAAGGLVASAFAAPTDLSSRVVKPNSIGFKHGVYNFETGKVEPVGGGVDRLDPIIWQSQMTTGYFFGLGNCGRPAENTELALDWGDMAANTVTGFQIGYATDSATDPNSVTILWAYGNNTNGFGDNEFPFIAGFFAGLPGLPPGFPYQFVGWFVTFDLTGSGLEFALGDQDLDGDTLADFGYFYTILDYGTSTATGPLLSEPNDPLSGPGAENAFDLYVQDPNHLCVDPNAGFFLDGTYWFGGVPFAQWHMVLYGGAAPGCPNPGCEDGDLDGDCIVGLSDLSALLTNFGLTGAGLAGDTDGDGDVDLADLSALLSQFGNNCN